MIIAVHSKQPKKRKTEEPKQIHEHEHSPQKQRLTRCCSAPLLCASSEGGWASFCTQAFLFSEQHPNTSKAGTVPDSEHKKRGRGRERRQELERETGGETHRRYAAVLARVTCSSRASAVRRGWRVGETQIKKKKRKLALQLLASQVGQHKNTAAALSIGNRSLGKTKDVRQLLARVESSTDGRVRSTMQKAPLQRAKRPMYTHTHMCAFRCTCAQCCPLLVPTCSYSFPVCISGLSTTHLRRRVSFFLGGRGSFPLISFVFFVFFK
jgi:hypothetical protein